MTVCSILQIVQPSKSGQFKVSSLRGPLGTKVLFNIYDDVIALTFLKRLVRGFRHSLGSVLSTLYCLSTLWRCPSVDFPQASGPRTQACVRFYLSTLKSCHGVLTFPYRLVRGPRHDWVRFKHLESGQCVLISTRQEVWGPDVAKVLFYRFRRY